MIACLSLLTGCGASARSGSLDAPRLDPPPAELVQEIPPPTRLPDGPMTQAQVERYWSADRAALVTGGKRQRALVGWIETRDAALRGGPIRLTP